MFPSRRMPLADRSAPRDVLLGIRRGAPYRSLILLLISAVCSVTLNAAARVEAQELPAESPGSVNPQDVQTSADQLVNLKAIEQQLRERLEQTNNDPFVLHKLGSVLYRQGKILEARKVWDQAANKDENVSDADISIALELLAKGDVKATIQALNAAQKKNDKNPHLYLARGDLFFRKQDFANAEAEFKKALELNPNLLVTHIWLGRYHQLQKNLEEAKKHYVIGTEVAAERAEAWVLLAAIQFQTSEIEEALNSLEQAEKHDFEKQLAEVRMANFYLAVNDVLGARKFLLQAVERKPDELVARLTLADVLLRLSRPEEARVHLEYTLQKDDNLKAIVTLAELERREAHYDRAEELYRRGLENQPDHVVLNNNLAMTLLSSKPHNEETLRLAETAMKGAAQNPGIQGTYVCALIDVGKTDEALKALPTLVRQLPSDPWIRYAYGKLLADQKRVDEAREQLEGCLILDEKFPRRQEVEELLSTLQ